MSRSDVDLCDQCCGHDNNVFATLDEESELAAPTGTTFRISSPGMICCDIVRLPQSSIKYILESQYAPCLPKINTPQGVFSVLSYALNCKTMNDTLLKSSLTSFTQYG